MKTNLSSRIARLVTGGWLVGALVLACNGLTTSDNSETHFLEGCADSCPNGLECICGVCTRLCTESSACGDLHPAAQCANSCSDAPMAQICELPCSDDESCSTLGTNFECAAGRCRQAGEPGSGGSGGSNMGAAGTLAVGGGAGRASDGGQGGVRPGTGGVPSGATGGTAAPGGSNGSAGGSGAPVQLLPGPVDGRFDATGNLLGIQGDIFGFADTFSALSMTENFTGMNACIAGTAARVDLTCTPIPPATDCYGMYWGAAIGFNLNQPIDPDTMMGVQPPLPYDASALSGFVFDLSGAKVPTTLRFRVDTPTGEYCNLYPTKMLAPGTNIVLFSELQTECWTSGGESGEAAKSNVVRIVWQVVTNTSATVPFDFCVSNIGVVE